MGFGWDLRHGKMIRVLPESGVLMIVAGKDHQQISQMETTMEWKCLYNALLVKHQKGYSMCMLNY
jgi:hypothetical protein